MDYQKLEEAIKSDLKSIPTLKMGYVPAKSYYGPIFDIAIITSFVLLFINMLVRIVLMITGLVNINFTPILIIGTWVGSFMVSFLLSFKLRPFILMHKLVDGRLKTEHFIKKQIKYCIMFYLVTYTIAYTLLSLFTSPFINELNNEPIVLLLFLTISQFGGYLIAMFITIFFAFAEVERIGMGIVFNNLADLVMGLIKNRNPYIDKRDF